jgi:hypothetical protein
MRFIRSSFQDAPRAICLSGSIRDEKDDGEYLQTQETLDHRSTVAGDNQTRPGEHRRARIVEGGKVVVTHGCKTTVSRALYRCFAEASSKIGQRTQHRTLNIESPPSNRL